MKHIFRFDAKLESHPKYQWKICEHEYQRIKKVLRLNAGDQIEVHNGKGKWSQGKLIKDSDEFWLQSDEIIQEDEPDPKIHVSIGMIKSEKWLFTISALVELGASNIIFFGQANTPKKLFSEKSAIKLNQYASDACKLAKKSWSTEVFVYKNIDEYLASISLNTEQPFSKFYLHKDGDAFGPLLQKNNQQLIHLCVGGERGFTDIETQALTQHQFIASSIGKNTLQATTAAITATGIVAST